MRILNHLLTLATFAAAAHAQVPESATVLAPGARVRITTPDLPRERVVAVYSDTRADTLILMRYQGPRADSLLVPLRELQSIEVSRGSRRRALTYGIAGAILGAIGGGLWGNNATIPADGPECTFLCSTEPTRIGWYTGASIGLGVGGTLGALFGRYVLGETWVPVSIVVVPNDSRQR
jgi:hypothetical protein